MQSQCLESHVSPVCATTSAQPVSSNHAKEPSKSWHSWFSRLRQGVKRRLVRHRRRRGDFCHSSSRTEACLGQAAAEGKVSQEAPGNESLSFIKETSAADARLRGCGREHSLLRVPEPDHGRLKAFPLSSNVQMLPAGRSSLSQSSPDKRQSEPERHADDATSCRPSTGSADATEHRPTSSGTGRDLPAGEATENGEDDDTPGQVTRTAADRDRAELSLVLSDRTDTREAGGNGREEAGRPREIVVVMSWESKERRITNKRRGDRPRVFASPFDIPASDSSSCSSCTASGSSIRSEEDAWSSDSFSAVSSKAGFSKFGASGAYNEHTDGSEGSSLASVASSISSSQSVFSSPTEENDSQCVGCVDNTEVRHRYCDIDWRRGAVDGGSLVSQTAQFTPVSLDPDCSFPVQRSPRENSNSKAFPIVPSSATSYKGVSGIDEVRCMKEVKSDVEAAAGNAQLDLSEAATRPDGTPADAPPYCARSISISSFPPIPSLSLSNTCSSRGILECRKSVTTVEDSAATKLLLDNTIFPLRSNIRVLSLLPIRRVSPRVRLSESDFPQCASRLGQRPVSATAARSQNTTQAPLPGASGRDLMKAHAGDNKKKWSQVTSPSSPGASVVVAKSTTDSRAPLSRFPRASSLRHKRASELIALPSQFANAGNSSALSPALDRGACAGASGTTAGDDTLMLPIGDGDPDGRASLKAGYCWTQDGFDIRPDKYASSPSSGLRKPSGDLVTPKRKQGTTQEKEDLPPKTGSNSSTTSSRMRDTRGPGRISHSLNTSTWTPDVKHREEKKEGGPMMKIGRAAKMREHPQAQQQSEQNYLSHSRISSRLHPLLASCKRAFDVHKRISDAAMSPRIHTVSATSENSTGKAGTEESEKYTSSAGIEREPPCATPHVDWPNNSAIEGGVSQYCTREVESTSMPCLAPGAGLIDSSFSGSRSASSPPPSPQNKGPPNPAFSTTKTKYYSSGEEIPASNPACSSKHEAETMATQTAATGDSPPESHVTAYNQTSSVGVPRVSTKESQTPMLRPPATELATREGEGPAVRVETWAYQHVLSEGAESQRPADPEYLRFFPVDHSCRSSCSRPCRGPQSDIDSRPSRRAGGFKLLLESPEDAGEEAGGKVRAECRCDTAGAKSVNFGNESTSGVTSTAGCAHGICLSSPGDCASHRALPGEQTGEGSFSLHAGADNVVDAGTEDTDGKQADVAQEGFPAASCTRQLPHTQRNSSSQSQEEEVNRDLPEEAASVQNGVTKTENTGCGAAVMQPLCQRASTVQAMQEAHPGRPLVPAARELTDTAGEASVYAELLRQTERVFLAVGQGFVSVVELGASALRSLVAAEFVEESNTLTAEGNSGNSAAAGGPTPTLSSKPPYSPSSRPCTETNFHVQPVVRKLCPQIDQTKGSSTEDRAARQFQPSAANDGTLPSAVTSASSIYPALNSVPLPGGSCAPYCAMTSFSTTASRDSGGSSPSTAAGGAQYQTTEPSGAAVFELSVAPAVAKPAIPSVTGAGTFNEEIVGAEETRTIPREPRVSALHPHASL